MEFKYVVDSSYLPLQGSYKETYRHGHLNGISGSLRILDFLFV